MAAPAAVLLLSCRDRAGLVARLSQFVFQHGGNIIDLDEHVDSASGQFFMRIAWEMAGFALAENEVAAAFAPVGRGLDAEWRIAFTGNKVRVAIFVSRLDHCLQEILWRERLGEFPIEIRLVLSNHEDLRRLAEQHNIPYFVFPVTPETRSALEERELALLHEYRVETIVLARYMQILGPHLVDAYPNQIINIHHSFLPAFAGSSPYKQAFERGVKIIGATSHYVTRELDEGPIIEQDIVRISHKDTIEDLVRKGRDLERMILARAVYAHAQNRILVHGRKTIVF
jgi:formyltetrahydrofolate deformylase